MYKLKGLIGIRKFAWKIKSHEGSSRLTRKVESHLICYIYTLIAQEKDFSHWLLKVGIGENICILRSKYFLTFHYWN